MNYKGPHINSWAILFGTLSILFIIILLPMPSFMKFIFFCLFSALFGINLSDLTNGNFNKGGGSGSGTGNKDEKQKNGSSSSNKEIIQLSILQTMAVFGAMFLFGAFLLATGTVLSFQFAGFLFYALLFLILARIGMYFSGTINKYMIALSMFGIILFSLYIIYDTNMILRRDYYGDFITASMDYYLDVLNLFTNLFNLNNN
jgi:FtsH-binding integral membrane protein